MSNTPLLNALHPDDAETALRTLAEMYRNESVDADEDLSGRQRTVARVVAALRDEIDEGEHDEREYMRDEDGEVFYVDGTGKRIYRSRIGS